MQAFGRNEALREALSQTFAAHVHNNIQDMFVGDLIREIGAPVLDRNLQSASVAAAMEILKDPAITQELKKDYEQVIEAHIFGEEKLSIEMRQAVREMHRQSELDRNLREFSKLKEQLAIFANSIFNGDIPGKLWKARSKAIANYDVVREGADWKLWRVDATGLTYGQVDEYIEECTKTIEYLSVFVRRSSWSFEDVTGPG